MPYGFRVADMVDVTARFLTLLALAVVAAAPGSAAPPGPLLGHAPGRTGAAQEVDA